MEIGSAILQFGGSLVAILLLAGLAYWWGLGGKPRIRDEYHARLLAGEVVYGFDPVDCSLDENGAAAVMQDHAGRIMVLKRHGSHFAGRILTGLSSAGAANGQLTINSGERRFGRVTLAVPDGQGWAKRIA